MCDKILIGPYSLVLTHLHSIGTESWSVIEEEKKNQLKMLYWCIEAV